MDEVSIASLSAHFRINTGCTMGCTVVRQEMPYPEEPIWWSSGQPPIIACNLAPGTKITIGTYKEAVLQRTRGAGGITGDAKGFLNCFKYHVLKENSTFF